MIYSTLQNVESTNDWVCFRAIWMLENNIKQGANTIHHDWVCFRAIWMLENNIKQGANTIHHDILG